MYIILKVIHKLKELLSKNDRGSFRLRRIIYTAISTLGSRAVTMLVSIVSLPLTINYIGAERFGMLETIVSLIAMMAFADLGLGFGLQNRIAELQSEPKGSLKLKKSISSVFYLLVFVTFCLAIFLFALFPSISWSKVFNVKSQIAIDESSISVLCFLICFLIQVPFSIVRKIQNGFQEGYKNGLWKSLGNVFGLITLLVVVRLKLGVPYIILAVYGSNALFLLMNFFVHFYYRKELLPSFAYFEVSVIKKLYGDGIIFFGLQIANIILMSSDRIIIAQVLDAKSVALYSVAFRLVTIFITPIESFIYPLLPAFNDAIANNDLRWIKMTLQKITKSFLYLTVFFGLLLYFTGNIVVSIWIGDNMVLTNSILLAFCFYISYSVLNAIISNVMLTPIFIKKLLIVYSFAVLLSLILKLAFSSMFGIGGIVWGTIIGMTVFFLVPSLYQLKRNNLL